MYVKPEPIVNDSNLVHLENALLPNVVRLLGKSKLKRFSFL